MRFVEIPDGIEPDSDEDAKAVHMAACRIDMNDFYSDYSYEICEEEDA